MSYLPLDMDIDPNIEFAGTQSRLKNLPDLEPEDFDFDEDENFEPDVEENRQLEDIPFYSNLAEYLKESELNLLASNLIEAIDGDKESRSEWEDSITVAMKYTGFNVQEPRKKPFIDACGAFDTTMATALFTSYAHQRAELLPPEGPAKSKINGIPTEASQAQADRVSSWINHYLTDVDRPYYSDSEKLFLHATFMGSAFKQVYQDPILNRPLSRFVSPQDFIIDLNTPNLMTSSRMTKIAYYTRREVILMENSGQFIKFDTPEVIDDEDERSSIQQTIDNIEGINRDVTDNKSLFKFYETYVELSEDEIEASLSETDGNKLPRPYIITICDSTKKIVAIRRNWREGDTEFKRKEYFVHYYYLPGFGIYGLGVAHLTGSNAIVLTNILRQQIDAGTLKNFPGGLRTAGIKFDNNDMAIGPTEFRPIDTGGLPIQQAIMLMPYGEPSAVLMQLRDKLIEQVSMLVGTVNMDLPNPGINAPVGTTLALLEVQNKVMSTVLRSFHTSMGYELKLLFDLFGEYLPDEPYPFMVQGKEQAIMRQDFNENVSIVPVSDPNILTTAHRVLLAESVMRLASTNPTLYNLLEVNRRMLQAMKVDGIDQLLIAPQEAQPLDPITENMNIMMGKPVKAAEWQEHDAHVATHSQLPPGPQRDAHIQEHVALKYYLTMQMEFSKLGMQLPPFGQMLEPQIQNEIAMYAAQIASQQAQAQQAQQPDPNMMAYQAAMADVQQRQEAAMLKDEETKLKTEVELEKARLKNESEMTKIDAQLEIAREKNAVDLTIAGMKQPPSPYLR